MAEQLLTPEVIEFLEKGGISFKNDIKEMLNKLGITTVESLGHLEQDDLEGLPVIIKRQLWRLSEPFRLEIGQYTPSGAATSVYPPGIYPGHHPYMMLSPSPSPISVSTLTQDYQPPVATAKPKFKLRYIMCHELFTNFKDEQYIVTLDPAKDTMENLISYINVTERVSDNLQVELFSEDGHPLNVNLFTMKLTLDQWKIQNEDGFYAFLRRKNQPAWEYEKLKPEDTVLTKVFIIIQASCKCTIFGCHVGSLSVKVICQSFGVFCINIDERRDDVKTVAMKIAKHINMPSEYFELHDKVQGYDILKNLDDVKMNKLIIVRLKPPKNLLRNYGKSSYIPTIEQTERGLAKFYSILKHTAESEGDINHRAIVAAVMKLTDCLPLATALHHLFTHKVISHVSSLVALFEGFYCLSRAILDFFFEVKPAETFEFVDYVFGLILKEASTAKDSELLHFQTIDLQCPITNRKMMQPFFITENNEVNSYEYLAAKEYVDERHALPGYSGGADITLEDLFPDITLEHHIIANSFGSLSKVTVLERNYIVKQLRHMPISVPGDWKDIHQSVSYIKVKLPDENMFERNVLTYIKDGFFAVTTDLKKDTDLTKVLYNPLTCQEESYTDEQLQGFVCNPSKVTHDIKQRLNAKVKGRASAEALMGDANVLPRKKDNKEITREPKEAIMVLIDTSASMTSSIFKETSRDVYTRIRAAKDFFCAFANRTQAYDFHHVIGVICFGSEVTVRLPLCEVVNQFKTTLETILATGNSTVLYEALNKATELLSEFGGKYPNCQKRILCLTDGQDNKSKITPLTVAQILQKADVVVDTVLINQSGYSIQKAICHATGGMCFVPEIIQEGLRLFETESLLSLRQRQRVKKISLTNQEDFDKLKVGKYNSSDPFSFQSRLFLDLEQTTTCSAKRMVLLASFAGDEIGTTKQRPHVKQILTEIRKYTKNPHPEIEIFPDDTNVCNWKILLKGPNGTPYHNGVFLLFAKFPDNYPYKPPEIRFITPIYHCNINSMGRICHPILGRNYVPSLSMKEIFDQVYGLLMAPEADDPLDSILAEEFHTNKEEYYRKAKALTLRKACSISWENYIKTLTSDEDTISGELTCPLTGRLYEDPVSTPYGHIYERHAIIKYMSKHGNLDPKAKRPLKIEDLRKDATTKRLADKFRKIDLV